MDTPVHIIIPCYNEEKGIVRLLEEIDQVAEVNSLQLTTVIVDDGSDDDTVERIRLMSLPSVEIRIISLFYNMGHQEAIAQGILFANSLQATQVIVMDGDGEDDPHTIPRLLALKDFDIIHVVRGKRSDPLMFRTAYRIYLLIFRMITNRKMNFGNFCMINERVIRILSVKSFIHFAAFLSRLNLKSITVKSDRRNRVGKRKMNIASLVYHAFRSFAEYSEALLMVFMRLFIILFVLFILTIGYIIYLKIFKAYPILGWTSTFGIGLLTAAIVCIGFFVTGILQLNITQRNNSTPVIQYKVVR
jgi:glycosyltransferase involved in cell wall biosynthesis